MNKKFICIIALALAAIATISCVPISDNLNEGASAATSHSHEGASAATSHSHEEASLTTSDGISWKSTDLGGGIFMLEGEGGNPGANLALLKGDEGVVLIDDGLDEVVQMTIATVEGIAGAPVSYVINTHAHGDHTGGNAGYGETGALIIAHDVARESLKADENVPEIGLPKLTFDESITLHLNGQTTNIFYVPNAHTDSDAVVHFTDANVIHAGDLLFNKIFPFIDLDNGGDIEGFIAAQQQILDIADESTQIIPGHGPLATKADLQAALDVLIDANTLVTALADQGMTLEQVLAENPLSVYEDWGWFHISTERMTNILYRSATTQ
ncbi:MAG: MBL fold metallo-hydrolase [Chloroflexota bacterium]